MDTFGLYQNLSRLFYEKRHVSPEEWDDATKAFEDAIVKEENADNLARCVIDDVNWSLPVSTSMKLLRKAKSLGANSKEFLIAYYFFLDAHLDPGPEHSEARAKHRELIGINSDHDA